MKTPAEILSDLLSSTKTSQRELAQRMGCSPQLLNSRLKRDTFPASDWMQAVASLGMKVDVTQADGSALKLPARRPITQRFRKVEDGIVYDWDHSVGLSHALATGGLYELCQLEDGTYFVVVQCCWPSLKTVIHPCDETDAKNFPKFYSTVDRPLV